MEISLEEEIIKLKRIISKHGEELMLLAEKISQQAGDIILLAEENNQLRSINNKLVGENSKLVEENNKLKERLGLNWKNSSLPPSRELYKQKRAERKKSERNPGGQPGHPAHQYQPMQADELVEVIADRCSCGHKLEKDDEYIIEQKIEIPSIKPYVTAYRRWYSTCTHCKKRRLAPLPAGVEKDLLGPHIKAIIAALNGYHQNSKREVQTILKDIFKLPLSLGLISNTAKRVNKRLEKSYKKLQQEVLTSPYLHIDETGHRHKGQRGWAWIVTNKQTSVLKLCQSRGKKVLEELVGPYKRICTLLNRLNRTVFLS